MATAEEWSEMENRAVKGRLFAQLPAQPDFPSSVLKAKKESSLTSSLFTDIPPPENQGGLLQGVLHGDRKRRL